MDVYPHMCAHYGSRVNIDGRTALLEEILVESHTIYKAAKAGMREEDMAAFDELLEVAQVRDEPHTFEAPRRDEPAQQEEGCE